MLLTIYVELEVKASNKIKQDHCREELNRGFRWDREMHADKLGVGGELFDIYQPTFK